MSGLAKRRNNPEAEGSHSLRLHVTPSQKKQFLLALADRTTNKASVSARALANLLHDHERMSTTLTRLGVWIDYET